VKTTGKEGEMAMRRDFGSIYRRPGASKYYVRFWAGKGASSKRYDRPAGPTKEIAKHLLGRVQHLLADRMPVAEVLHHVFGDPLPGVISFREAVPTYLEYAKANRRTNTVRGYAKLLAQVCREDWAAKNMDEIERTDIVNWKDKRQATGLSPQTINNGLAVTSAVFRWALERGLAQRNPVQGVRRLRTPKGRETYLTAPEARALVAAAPARVQLFLVVALNTGMRRGEILDLRWRAVDLEQGTLIVEDPKNHRPRTIRMNDTLRSEVARHALALGPKRRTPDRQVVAGLDGKVYTPWVLRTDLAKAVASCEEIPAHKRPKVTTHVLRHTAASLMVAAGVPIFDVAKVLGHETIQVTMRYAHFAPEAGKAAVEALDRILDLKVDVDRVEERLAAYTADSTGGETSGEGHSRRRGRRPGPRRLGAPKAQEMGGGRARESNPPATPCDAAQRF